MNKQTHSCPPGFTLFREDGRGQRVLRGAEPREAGPGTAACRAGARPGALITGRRRPTLVSFQHVSFFPVNVPPHKCELIEENLFLFT